MKPIRLVCATRCHPDRFMSDTALGRSLQNFAPQPEPQLQLFGDNRLGLSTVYNIALQHAEQDPAILVFVHDDIWLSDFFWMDRIYEGLQQFDVLGLAGNTRRVPKQPAWAFTTTVPKLQWDDFRNLSGTVGHGQGFPCKNISIFGPSKQECKLMDGLFLAADSEVLKRHGVRFDEQFAFHFYDMDFCRQAELKGLRMGTWPIAVVHESGGNFNSPAWREGYAKYLSKYAEGESTQAAAASRSVPSHSPTTANVHQIFYSEETRRQLDPGFIPLDNTGQRPDWCEYWPIRNYLLSHELNEDEFYGFLSPKFKQKTGLDAGQVHAFAASMNGNVDVVAFSPFFDQSALYRNVFDQAATHHEDAMNVFVACANLVKPGVVLNDLLNDSTNTVFCNYFLAKPRFWRYWLSKAEMIFELAERADTPLGQALSATTKHAGVDAFQTKVFFIERLVSLLLATEPQWQARFFDPASLPLAYPKFSQELNALEELDALKRAVRLSEKPELIQMYWYAMHAFAQRNPA